MSELRITPINDSKEEEGVWAKYFGVDLLIARSNTTKYNNLFRRLTKPYKRQLEKNNLDNDTMEEIMCEVMSETVLLDWKNFKGIEYTKENAKSLMKNDNDAFEFVKNFSEDINNYLNEDVDETVEK